MLKVEGIDPVRIGLGRDEDGNKVLRLDGREIAYLNDHGATFYGEWDSPTFRRSAERVINAAIDEWRVSGGKRLWPQSPPVPVDCVCGNEAAAIDCGLSSVECGGCGCLLRANTVEEWDVIQAALKAAKGGAA